MDSDSISDTATAEAERIAVEITLYSAYSLILEQLLAQKDEEGARTWMRLTAKGMRISTMKLIHDLQRYQLWREVSSVEE